MLFRSDLFRARYQSFRRLLSANNAALDIMTELEEASRGHRHFGMHFVRARVTAIIAKVFTMVDNMQALAPGKYDALSAAMRSIQEQIQYELEYKKDSFRTEYILDLEDITALDIDDVGGKMANLGELRNVLHVPVPSGFAITSHAYMTFMQIGRASCRERV